MIITRPRALLIYARQELALKFTILYDANKYLTFATNTEYAVIDK
jgi:hypothetical protein